MDKTQLVEAAVLAATVISLAEWLLGKIVHLIRDVLQHVRHLGGDAESSKATLPYSPESSQWRARRGR